MVTNVAEKPAAHDTRPPLRSASARAFALSEVRWATASTVLFLIGLVVELAGAPAWSWWALYLACYLAGGWQQAWSGLRALREKSLDVDLLMVVAAIGAALIGQVFDGALLIVIFATSGALEALATQRTEDSVRQLLELAPERAIRELPDGRVENVLTSELAVGETILVRPGERIGADGSVVEGTSDVDQASITGEPLPATKGPGHDVFAGTLNGAGALRIRVERDSSESVVARIVAMVEEASASKAKTQLFIEKIEQRYSLGVVAATLALFFIPLAFGADLRATLLQAMTFMIVASPCAVVLATMPPLLSAIANAGRHGVLVKSAVVMEQLGATTTVAFDKTGTLTEGTPRLTEVRALQNATLDERALLRLAAAAETQSEHPLARAVVAAAEDEGLDLPRATEFHSTAGQGVRARVNDRDVRVGSPAHVLGSTAEDSDGATSGAHEIAAEWERSGVTALAVLVDDVPVGVLATTDRLRSTARTAVAELSELTGTSPTLLTGDNVPAAERVASETGITDVRGGLLPQDKVAAVHELENAGARTLVVGDGVNDAPALAAANSGVAMRAGSDLALETADAVVVRDELATVPRMIELSRKARRLVVANLIIAGTFIGGLVVWDLVGTLPLPLGVAGHEGSTVIVGLNGLRLLRAKAWR